MYHMFLSYAGSSDVMLSYFSPRTEQTFSEEEPYSFPTLDQRAPKIHPIITVRLKKDLLISLLPLFNKVVLV